MAPRGARCRTGVKEGEALRKGGGEEGEEVGLSKSMDGESEGGAVQNRGSGSPDGRRGPSQLKKEGKEGGAVGPRALMNH